MCKLLLALACSVCACHGSRVALASEAEQGTAKMLSDMSEAQVSNPSSVLASLVLALRPETAFTPSASAAIPCMGKSLASGARPETSALTLDQVLLPRAQPCRLADEEVEDEETMRRLVEEYDLLQQQRMQEEEKRELTEEEKEEEKEKERKRQKAIEQVDKNIDEMFQGMSERMLDPEAAKQGGRSIPGSGGMGGVPIGAARLRPQYKKVKQIAATSFEAIQEEQKWDARRAMDKQEEERRRRWAQYNFTSDNKFNVDKWMVEKYNKELMDKQNATLQEAGNFTEVVSDLPKRFRKVERKDLTAMTSTVLRDPIGDATLPADASVVIVGASSALGRKVVQALTGADSSYQLKCLVRLSDAEVDFGEKCKTMDVSNFMVQEVLNNAHAIIFITNKVSEGGVGADTLNKLLNIIAKKSKVRRVVTTSIHGVENKKAEMGMEFLKMVAFGGFDKERDMETQVVLKAVKEFPSYSVLRIGGLEDDDGVPSLEAPSSRVALDVGDTLEGAVPISTAASVLAQSLTRIEAINATFTIGNANGVDAAGASASNEDFWQDQFSKAIGPDIFRRKSKVKPSFIRKWMRSFVDQGKLTSPVDLTDVKKGVLMRFLTRKSGYQKAGEIAGRSDGALLIVAEDHPTPRVRVTRTEMETNTIVKVQSEETLLVQLQADLLAEEKREKDNAAKR